MLTTFIHFLLAWFAYWRYGRPARKLIVVGVTGTKGKSTTSRLIASVLEAGGNKVGLLSTVEFQIGEKRWLNDKKMTMLGRGQIQSMLKQMVEAECKYVVVTDVNCYDEDPREIAEMLASGARLAGKKDNENLFIEVDRRNGIAKAISLARAGDVVVITAKGTEPFIGVADGKKIPWDDRKVAREILLEVKKIHPVK